ncbi:DUF424 domain-containing protein [Candidatus Pacearchaeota archaeon CG06_land_8_20_14_3_00_35_12]|nr:MAG: DUF424 domain-containing protein [Candidatus Pacearchaeota archaeon CG06_land_8_20_14_3_00_35_12]
MFVKIHEAYRKTVAVCDAELLGKRFEEGKKQLDVSKEFYGSEKKNEKEVLEILKDAALDDSTFNLVGKKAVAAGIKSGLISEDGVMEIKGIPYALSLL